jgi:hypothetical protein
MYNRSFTSPMELQRTRSLTIARRALFARSQPRRMSPGAHPAPECSLPDRFAKFERMYEQEFIPGKKNGREGGRGMQDGRQLSGE